MKGNKMELRQIDRSDYMFLYEILKQRDPTINISHKTMPTYVEHTKFWESKPYQYAGIIETDNTRQGYCYITRNNEIGIFIEEKHKGKGLGKKTIRILLRKFQGQTMYANINPLNEPSKNLFKKFGFKKIQETYKIIN